MVIQRMRGIERLFKNENDVKYKREIFSLQSGKTSWIIGSTD
jgi:hypothetical protein